MRPCYKIMMKIILSCEKLQKVVAKRRCFCNFVLAIIFLDRKYAPIILARQARTRYPRNIRNPLRQTSSNVCTQPHDVTNVVATRQGAKAQCQAPCKPRQTTQRSRQQNAKTIAMRLDIARRDACIAMYSAIRGYLGLGTDQIRRNI